MKSPWFPVLIGFLAGVLFVFCTTDDRESARDAGDAFAGEDSADGAGCCEPSLYTFTTLADGDVSSTSRVSDPVAIGEFREVVVYISRRCGTQPAVLAEFRADAGGTFGSAGQFVPGRLRVDGSELRLRYDCDFGSAHYTVVGVR